jgi:cytochrome b involved in lipid metabolism
MSKQEKKDLPKYTKEEIATHNENSKVQWIHVEGLVVDITQYKTIVILNITKASR